MIKEVMVRQKDVLQMNIPCCTWSLSLSIMFVHLVQDQTFLTMNFFDHWCNQPSYTSYSLLDKQGSEYIFSVELCRVLRPNKRVPYNFLFEPIKRLENHSKCFCINRFDYTCNLYYSPHRFRITIVPRKGPGRHSYVRHNTSWHSSILEYF